MQLGQYPPPLHVVAHLSDPHLLAGGVKQYGVIDTEAELRLAVETAASSGRPVAVHASTAEGMRRAALAGVQTIEHGDDGTPEVFRLMAQRGVALCPTVAAGDAVARYRGWRPGVFKFG